MERGKTGGRKAALCTTKPPCVRRTPPVYDFPPPVYDGNRAPPLPPLFPFQIVSPKSCPPRGPSYYDGIRRTTTGSVVHRGDPSYTEGNRRTQRRPIPPRGEAKADPSHQARSRVLIPCAPLGFPSHKPIATSSHVLSGGRRGGPGRRKPAPRGNLWSHNGLRARLSRARSASLSLSLSLSLYIYISNCERKHAPLALLPSVATIHNALLPCPHGSSSPVAQALLPFTMLPCPHGSSSPMAQALLWLKLCYHSQCSATMSTWLKLSYGSSFAIIHNATMSTWLKLSYGSSFATIHNAAMSTWLKLSCLCVRDDFCVHTSFFLLHACP